MGEKFGGFRTTGIWVLLKYALPLALFAGAVMYFSPQSRNSAVAAVHATLGQVVDLSQVPGLSGGYESVDVAGLTGDAPPPPPDGGFWFRTFGIGKPVVADHTPRVKLSDLPGTGRPNVVKLSDLPEPVDTIAYRLDTKSKKPAPVVYSSPRPRPEPTPQQVALALASVEEIPVDGLSGTWDRLTARVFRTP